MPVFIKKVLIYVLNASLLSYLMIPKATTTTESKVSESKEHSSRLAALSNFSIGDMIKDLREGPNSKSVKFPDKLIKVLEQKLQDIAMGKDPACVHRYLTSCLTETALPDIRTSLCGGRWASSMDSLWWIPSSVK